jgi:hypothetical protein
MGTMVKPSASGTDGGDFRPAPAGNQLALCVGVFDLGHHQDIFDGKPKWKPKVMYRFELCDELMDDGRPFVASTTLNMSLHENATFRKFVGAWKGGFTEQELTEGYDAAERLGKPAMLTIVHAPSKTDPKKIWANIEAAAPLPRRIAAPEPQNPLVYYSTDQGPPGPDVPERIRDKILSSREFAGKAIKAPAGNGHAVDPNDPDTPF